MKWEKKELGDLINLYDNIRIPLSAIERGKRQGEYPYYGAQSIIDYVNEYLFDGNYILIAEDGENLRTRTQPIAFAVSGQFWVNNHAHIIKGKENIASDLFIKYFLNNLDINPYVTGAAQPKLSQRNLKAISVDTPPLPTQRKIASILSAYDDMIENNLKRIKLLEEKAFLRYSLLDKVEKFKLSDLYDTSSGGTPSRTNAEYFTGDINWFKSKELADSVLLGSEEKITEGAVDKSSAKLFPVGSVIMAMYGATIGMLGILTQPSTTNQACCAIIQKDLIKSNYYILNWLLENREYILSFRMGAAQENISQMIIKNLLISIPKDRDLIQFNKEAEPIYQLVKNIHIQNTKLREARDILLPKLMNGQIEV